jgi:hypothetical protein
MNYDIWNCRTMMLLVALFASSIAGTAQTRFHVTSLKGLGGAQATAYGINNLGWVTGGGACLVTKASMRFSGREDP